MSSISSPAHEGFGMSWPYHKASYSSMHTGVKIACLHAVAHIFRIPYPDVMLLCLGERIEEPSPPALFPSGAVLLNACLIRARAVEIAVAAMLEIPNEADPKCLLDRANAADTTMSSSP
jgi:hypothetical protein